MSQPFKPTSPVRLGKLLLVSGLIFYVLFFVLLAIFQRRMIYQPPVFSSDIANGNARPSNLERWTNSSGQSVGWRRASRVQPAQGQLLITYGKGSCAIGCAKYADAIQSVAPFDVFILEYPGYADRPGSPTQDSFFSAADEAFQLLNTNTPIYLLGESLGSGVASYLAGTHPDKVVGIVLLSPYNCLADVAQYYMPIFPVRLVLIDRFQSEDYLRNYHGKVGIVVDGKDIVVPEKFGLRLYNEYASSKKLWEFPNGGHIAIMESPDQFWKEVVGFWQNNQTTK